MNKSAHWIGFRAGLGGLPALLLAASCARTDAPSLLQSSESQGEPTRGASAGLAVPVSAPFDIGATVRRVQRSFRATAQGFKTADATSLVHVDPQGFVEVTPRRTDREAQRITTGTPMRLETSGIRRGGGAPASAGEVRQAGDGLEIPRGEAVERIVRGDDGLEQSWGFASRPSGEGDLEVRVRVRGQRYAGETSQGLHFVDPESGLGVRYGWATWVGADGARMGLRGVWRGDEIVMTVPSSLLDGAKYPAVLDPLITPEFGIDNPVLGPELGSNARYAVTYGGGQYLVVWVLQSAANDVLMGTRVKSDGTVLDPTGFAIQPINATGYLYAASAASDGTDFLVAWSLNGEGLKALRVTGDGKVGGTPVSLATANSQTHSIGFDGTNYLAVWTDQRNQIAGASAPNQHIDIYAGRVSKAGVALDPSGVAVASKTRNSRDPFVACDGTNCLAAWTDYAVNQNGEAYGVLIDKNAALVGTPARIPQAYSMGSIPRGVAFGAGQYAVTWTARPNSTTHRVALSRVTTAGQTLDTTGALIATKYLTPLVAYDGQDYLTAWRDGATIYRQRFSAAALPVDPAAVEVAANAGSTPVLAAGSGGSIVVTTGNVNNASTLDAWRLNQDGSAATPAKVTVGGEVVSETSPRVASSGSNLLVAWTDSRTEVQSRHTLYGARLGNDGAMLDPSGIPIFAPLYNAHDTWLVHDGTDYLAAWNDQGLVGGTPHFYLRTARLSAAGEVLDTPSHVVADELYTYPGRGLACTPGLCAASMITNQGLRVFRFKPDGTVLDSPEIELTTTSSTKGGSASFDGTNFVVTWNDTVKTQARRLSQAGVLLDSTPIQIDSTAHDVAAASDEAGTLFVWANANGVFGRRLQSDGTLLDATPITICENKYPKVCKASAAAVTWDGSRYVVAWRDTRVTTPEIYAARVTPAGQVLDANNGVLVTSPFSNNGNMGPTLARVDHGKAVIVYANDYADPAGNKYTRLRARMITLGSDIAAGCALHADCMSGYCVDGVCCSTPCDGICEACSAATKGSGADGTCGPAKQGLDPHETCKDDGSPLCTKNGLCDGKGACQSYPTPGSCIPTACTTDAQCSSGMCRDNVCCNAACGGLCEACSVALKGQGVDGLCEPIGDGLDPQAECATGGQSTCQGDFVCNGAGLCRSGMRGQVCNPAESCDGENFQYNPDRCDEKGVCQDKGTSPCYPYFCSGTVCKTSCLTDDDCQAPLECINGSCGTGKAIGAVCATDSECSLGHCVDNFCCDTACNAPCSACSHDKKGTGENGICGAAADGTPDSDCPTAGLCEADGKCNGAGDCRTNAPAGTSCGTSVCIGPLTTSGQVCDGSGTCGVSSGTSCGQYKCSQTTGKCLAECASDDDCAPGSYCNSVVCTPKLDPGQVCSVAAQCKSGFCADGICCDRACDKQCESCSALLNAAGKDGQCGLVKGGTLDPQGVCKKDTSNFCGLDGKCDDEGQCRVAPNLTPCGQPKCENNAAVTEACDGFGKCQADVKDCVRFKCDAETKTCKTTCATSDDCATGSVCDPVSKQCAISGATCVNETTLKLADGTEHSCAPYECQAGACRTSCDTAGDCAAGKVCTNNKCVDGGDGGQSDSAAPSTTVTSDSGCGCKTAGGSRPGLAGALGALAAVGLLWRRRRERSRSSSRSA